MFDDKFRTRILNFGIRNIIVSPDFIVGLITLCLAWHLSGGSVAASTGQEMLTLFSQISASLFGIVLAGLAIVTSFTDDEFINAWKKIGEFNNLITLFQYNLYLPIIVLIASLWLKFGIYNGIAMILLTGFFAYMLISLIDLINFISKYGLQRGKFVENKKEED
jgi:hypothetical protein